MSENKDWLDDILLEAFSNGRDELTSDFRLEQYKGAILTKLDEAIPEKKTERSKRWDYDGYDFGEWSDKQAFNSAIDEIRQNLGLDKSKGEKL